MNNSVKPIKFQKGKLVIQNNKLAVMQILLSLLTFFTLITPRDTLGLKKIFLAISLLYGIDPIFKGLKKNKPILVFTVVLPFLMYIVSSITTGSITSAFNYLYAFVYVLLIFPIIEWDIDIKKITIIVGNIMVFIIIFSCFIDFIGLLSVYTNPLLHWLNSNGEAKISKSPYAMFRYVLFFNASPILFFNLTHYIKNNKKTCISFTFIALLLTGTRANIFLGVVLLVFGILFISNKSYVKIFFAMLLLVITVFMGRYLFERYNILAIAKETGDLSRLGGLDSIFKVLNSNKQYWITGMGFGSEYYNSGKKNYVVTSELSYFEFIREIGLPLSIAVFGFIFAPLIKLLKNDRFIFISYGAYLLAGVLEPFIFTSTGFFIIMMIYAYVYQLQKINVDDSMLDIQENFVDAKIYS